MTRINAIIFLVILASCGPANKLRRAQRLIDKAELQGAQWRVDTVFKEVPVIVEEIRVDTAVVVVPGDSVTIFRDRVQVKIKRLAGDTVFVDVKVPADTVKVNVPTIINREITTKGWLRWWHLVIAFAVGVVLGRLVLKMLI